MKKILAYATAMATLVGVPTGAFAQNSSTATANSSVDIIRPLVITKNVDLVFGRIVRPSTGNGSVAIANTGDSVNATGAVALGGTTTSRAKFTIDGEGGQSISVTVPTTFDLKNGANTITVTLSPDLAATGVVLSNALGSAGSKTLFVGGSFTLPSSQASGAYTGTFDVGVSYE